MLKIKSEVTGTVWKVLVSAGQSVEADEVLAIVESMKMEIPISAERAGQVSEVLVAEGDPVAEDQVVIHLV
ncbi:MAG: acetyl-CoA carboxylase biotin carboxyl carrier protein subunit [Pseudomonadota bacterium]|jgi:acetyl-CoA carboxylase biotin carboxyl carrier protein|uniref:acetyl-CoA carboxylase biotin carboxyl carrier protein subunit n=1 Tax=Limnohabitans sp. 103DPR2 TaxID=1678129 RepID=UPI0006DCDEC5|nr:acetyl-CoA carboxylase biotin carboxyl carrier protein subunit [Limnohabitans sp. 103DPR2]ALK92350.1 Biotin/lipoyl attachment protein [Limnohabitans sp. 103DPR2]MBU3722819.1 acetyl-CoA carboxylase biotin carboxyl carrier protein subunit [Limnohabitans sp.]MDE3231871.1 acetyl-CoA carboxylase biotin carboxyl carrier protein subunit [Pseudomonadota bacterium]